MLDSYRRSRSGGARANGFPLHAINWGVVYVNDEQEFSVELLWVNPRWDAQMGFVPMLIGNRPLPANHRVERTVCIAAPVDRVWNLVTDHRGMPKWFPLDTAALEREGWPAPNGVGAERAMRPGGEAERHLGPDERAGTGARLGFTTLARLPADEGSTDLLPPGSCGIEASRGRHGTHLEHPVSGEDSRHLGNRATGHGQDARRRAAAAQETGRVGLIRRG